MWKLLVTIILCQGITVTAESYTEADNIYKTIIGRNNPKLRPRLDQSDSVLVNVSINLNQVIDLDVVKELLTVELWLTQVWQDQISMWNTSGNTSAEEMHLSENDIWVPDIAVQNTRKRGASMIQKKSRVRMNSSGWTRLDTEDESVTSCKISVHKFPFDKHLCHICLKSEHYLRRKLTIASVVLAKEYFSANGEWDVQGVSLVEEFGPFIRMSITLKRQFLYYLLNLLLPIVIISTINPFVFLVKAETGEKVSISVTLFLSFTVFLSLLSGMLPKTSNSTSIVSLYVCLQLILSGVYVICCVFIQRVSQMKEHNWFTMFVVCGRRGTSPDQNQRPEESETRGDIVKSGTQAEVAKVSDLSFVASKLDRYFFVTFFALSCALTVATLVFITT